VPTLLQPTNAAVAARASPRIKRPVALLRRAAPARDGSAAGWRDKIEEDKSMWWIFLEALGAGLLLVAIVWWTMFAGRRGGERQPPQD
jgi:hypothetical protein